MAHFAELDENNIVLRVIVVDNKDIVDENSIEKEGIGIAFCNQLLAGRWIQTSYNNSFRKNYAGIGYTYREDLDAFVAPRPENNPSFILNDDARWVPPIAPPGDIKFYNWDEETLSWYLNSGTQD